MSLEFFNPYEFSEINPIEQRHENILDLRSSFENQMYEAEARQLTGTYSRLAWVENVSPNLLPNHYKTTNTKEQDYLKIAAEEIADMFLSTNLFRLLSVMSQATDPNNQLTLNLDLDQDAIVKSITVPVFRNHPYILQQALNKVPKKGVERFLKAVEGKQQLSSTLTFEDAEARMSLFYINERQEFVMKGNARIGFLETKEKGILISHVDQNTQPSTLPKLFVLIKPLK
jgi:hypothetical protein